MQEGLSSQRCPGTGPERGQEHPEKFLSSFVFFFSFLRSFLPSFLVVALLLGTRKWRLDLSLVRRRGAADKTCLALTDIRSAALPRSCLPSFLQGFPRVSLRRYFLALLHSRLPLHRAVSGFRLGGAARPYTTSDRRCHYCSQPREALIPGPTCSEAKQPPRKRADW